MYVFVLLHQILTLTDVLGNIFRLATGDVISGDHDGETYREADTPASQAQFFVANCATSSRNLD